MFADKNLQFATQNPELWKAFLGRFNDISPDVSIRTGKNPYTVYIFLYRNRTNIKFR